MEQVKIGGLILSTKKEAVLEEGTRFRVDLRSDGSDLGATSTDRGVSWNSLVVIDEDELGKRLPSVRPVGRG